MKRMRTVLMALAAGLMAASAAGKTLYVNVEALFDGYYKTRMANVVFDDRRQEKDNEAGLIKREIDALTEEAKKLDAEVRNELLGQTTRETAYRKLQATVERLRAKGVEFEQFRAKAIQDLQRIRLEREDALVQEILVVVNAVADEKQADTVIDVSGKTLNRIPGFIRYPKADEVTDEILVRLNKGHEKELKEATDELARRQAAATAPAAAPAAPAPATTAPTPAK